MDPQVVAALVVLAGAIITAAFAIWGKRADTATTAPDQAVTRLGAVLGSPRR